jgi:hypothetical protein
LANITHVFPLTDMMSQNKLLLYKELRFSTCIVGIALDTHTPPGIK